MKMALQLSPQLPLPLSLSSTTTSSSSSVQTHVLFSHRHLFQLSLNERLSRQRLLYSSTTTTLRRKRKKNGLLVANEDTELRVQEEEEEEEEDEEELEEEEAEEEGPPPTPQDLQNIEDIKRVLDLLKKNRDMLFNEVKLTIMIEDPREVERRRLLGIDDDDAPTRDDLVEALVEANEGKIPRNRVALQMLAEEMRSWPNLEVEPQKKKPSKSLYARVTDTGVDPEEAADRLKLDWDSAAEIEEAESSDDTEVPAAVGYGALYLVTAFPVIIGISVVLILFYNSLQ
ncbi:Ycf3-interacting protein 1, chloroplastic [Turnera subulata]|uniref:Ycf3-interacting protein 1, chloroplastic n=1 Tax=Turnera subulata TaxID=218843 RepID=A0A9Q0JHR5_9ROSI|nr:Ycf3-interacting protein 1, chloroplastic [Turnera subulata]